MIIANFLSPVRLCLWPACGSNRHVSANIAGGQVLTDSLVYVAINGLEADLSDQLQTGLRPVGISYGRWTCCDVVDVGHGDVRLPLACCRRTGQLPCNYACVRHNPAHSDLSNCRSRLNGCMRAAWGS
jgi:hypothetical protein